jgi:hypothetical protein
MTLEEYRTYFKEVAKDNKRLSHQTPAGKVAFKEITIQDVMDGISVDLDDMTLFIEAPNIRAQDGLSDNPRKVYSAAFVVMMPLKDVGDTDKIIEYYDQTEVVTEQILSRILNDAKKARNNKNYIFKINGFDVNSVSYEPVGPIFNGWYGFRTAFTINQTFTKNLILDETKWYTALKSTIR